jgi:hypothetical protein
MTKKLVSPLDIREHEAAYPIADARVPDWRFRSDERSPGHYVVEGCDRWGRSCSLEGADPEALLVECVCYARALQIPQD